MKVPYQLRRSSDPVAPASAVLIEGEADAVHALVNLLGQLALGRLPGIYRVAGGFVVEVEPGVILPPGSTRLRRLSGHLYLPVDAELIPPLLTDEAEGLGRSQGMVFRPGGALLGFDPTQPVDPASLLVARQILPAADWRAFPERPVRAKRIRVFSRKESETDPDSSFPDLLDDRDGKDDDAGIGTETPARPEMSGPLANLTGRALGAMGQALIGLGKLFGNLGLAEVGARWVRDAMEQVPRLTEALLGRQEAALRELLKRFQTGDIDKALRHAIPLNQAGEAQNSGVAGSQLPEQDSRYSLASLLRSARGPSAPWFVKTDLHRELSLAYEAAADAAEKAGDFRRAALIRGRLLNDIPGAAALLERAGLWRDAATVYLRRLDDGPNAARCFERAGDLDRALALYRDCSLHTEAGHLLRRLGEDEQAEKEFVIAALWLIDPLAAGDLLRDHARRPDLAVDAYAQGWQARPARNAVPCALRLAQIHASGQAIEPLNALIDEVDEWFDQPCHHHEANVFYNDLAKLADTVESPESRDDLRDRALMGLGTVLGWMARGPLGASRAGPYVSSYLGSWATWPADLVADAQHASIASLTAPSPQATFKPAPRRISVGGLGQVTAACHAAGSGDLFLGFDEGAVVQVMVETGEISLFPTGRRADPCEGLSCDAEGTILVYLTTQGGRRTVVWRKDGIQSGWQQEAERYHNLGLKTNLTPITRMQQSHRYGVFDEARGLIVNPVETGPRENLMLPGTEGVCSHRVACLFPDVIESAWLALVADEQGWRLVSRSPNSFLPLTVPWRPHRPEGRSSGLALVSWFHVDSNHLEVAGIDDAGAACWMSLDWSDGQVLANSRYQRTKDSRYQVVALVRPGLVAAAGQDKVDWLRHGPNGFTCLSSTAIDLAEVVGCFANPRTRELVAVGADGTLSCVAIPESAFPS